MPKVSVVIPVYNTARYLQECVESALRQTLEDIEVICVNDGSTDASRQILEDYALNDARVTIIDQENRGLSAARNAGAAAASGEYLYFLDSDDYIDTNAFKRLYEQAKRDRLDVLHFDAAVFFEDDELELEHASYKTYYIRNREYPDVVSGEALLVSMVENYDHKPSVWLQFIRTDFYVAAGLSFYEGILHEDNLFSFVCGLQAQRAAYLAEPYFHRRMRRDSIMTVERGAANFKGYFVTHLEMLRYVLRHDFSDRTTSAVVRLCEHMYQQALEILCELPEEEAEAITRIDCSPEGLLTCELLTSQRNAALNAHRLQAELQETEQKIAAIRDSRSYKLNQYLRRLLRGGRGSAAR
jgi:glycosyltransferase involved in cell wall biosynthesis